MIEPGMGMTLVAMAIQTGPMGERVAKVEQWMDSHERQCNVRHTENQDRLVGLENNLQRLVWGVGATLIIGLTTLIIRLVSPGHGL